MNVKPHRSRAALPRPVTAAAILLAAIVAIPALRPARAAEELTDGREIAARSDRARRAETEHQVMTMILENARGQRRVRTIEGWSHELSDNEERRFARFLKPSDVRNTTLLTYDYDDKDDDIWLYLPALKKVKRILSSNKKDYFMGSDFTYEDMENLDLVNWDYKLIGSEAIDGVDCYVIEETPNNEKEAKESGYSKRISWIAKTDFLPRRVDFYDKKGRLAKRLHFEDIHPTSPDDPRPRAHKLTMENFITKHKTILIFDKLELDVPINDEVFSQRNLRQ